MSFVFVYAEQMADPQLQQLGARPAVLPGYHRSFDRRSVRLWGSPEHPCPVLGLAPGGECQGLAIPATPLAKRRLARRLGPLEGPGQYRKIRRSLILDRREVLATFWASAPPAAPAAQPILLEALREAHGTVGRGVEYVRTVVQAMTLWRLSDPVVEEAWAQLADWRPR